MAELPKTAFRDCNLTQSDFVEIEGRLGYCGSQRVFLGFAPARLLCALSYADVLNEETGAGYQRRIAREHSLAFKRYIQTDGASTIPLTFNLRDDFSDRWSVVQKGTVAVLKVDGNKGPVLTQVDGQHRLGFLQDSPVSFAFMVFIGLSENEEMDIFRTINGKAKGLSSSLLDFTAAKTLGADLAEVDPALFIAIGLNSEPSSPWFRRLDLGGGNTIGPKRVASLRTMHQAVNRMLKVAKPEQPWGAGRLLEQAIAFWNAVKIVLPAEWAAPRQHMLIKGIGVYSLMSLAGQLISESESRPPTVDYFVSKLSDFIEQIDWSNHGPLEGYGGAKGADMAFKMILEIRKENYLRLSHRG
jgi:DNA sulfur modification protein DndB